MCILLWDVVNERLSDDGELRASRWRQALGDDYIERALWWADEVDPSAKLFINAWGADDLGIKSDRLYSLAKDLLGRGAPLHGIGFQMHVAVGGSRYVPDAPPLERLRRTSRGSLGWA